MSTKIEKSYGLSFLGKTLGGKKEKNSVNKPYKAAPKHLPFDGHYMSILNLI